MSTPSLEELQDRSRFRLLRELRHDRLQQGLRPLLWARSPVMLTFWSASLAALALATVAGARAGRPAFDAFSLVALGMVATWLAALPVHELIHAAAYRLGGARGVVVRYRLRTLSAYCLADGAVVGGRAFAWAAAAPSLVLDPLLLGLVLALPDGPWRAAAAGGLLLHVGAASGDVALLQLAWEARGRRLWTYDLEAEGRSVFLVEAPPDTEPAPPGRSSSR